MAKFIMKNGSFWISKTPAPTPIAITAATKGTTTVLTATNTAAVDDIVIVSGSGWASLDGKPAVVTVASATSITVAVDTSAETSTFGAGAEMQIYDDADFVEACLQGVNLESGTADTIAVGTFCDAGASLAGAIPNGSLALTGFVDPTDAGYNELTVAAQDGLPRLTKLVLPKAANPSSTSNNGGVFYFPNGTVGAISQSYQTNAAATFSSTILVGGKATFVPAPTA